MKNLIGTLFLSAAGLLLHAQSIDNMGILPVQPQHGDSLMLYTQVTMPNMGRSFPAA